MSLGMWVNELAYRTTGWWLYFILFAAIFGIMFPIANRFFRLLKPRSSCVQHRKCSKTAACACWIHDWKTNSVEHWAPDGLHWLSIVANNILYSICAFFAKHWNVLPNIDYIFFWGIVYLNNWVYILCVLLFFQIYIYIYYVYSLHLSDEGLQISCQLLLLARHKLSTGLV